MSLSKACPFSFCLTFLANRKATLVVIPDVIQLWTPLRPLYCFRWIDLCTAWAASLVLPVQLVFGSGFSIGMDSLHSKYLIRAQSNRYIAANHQLYHRHEIQIYWRVPGTGLPMLCVGMAFQQLDANLIFTCIYQRRHEPWLFLIIGFCNRWCRSILCPLPCSRWRKLSTNCSCCCSQERVDSRFYWWEARQSMGGTSRWPRQLFVYT